MGKEGENNIKEKNVSCFFYEDVLTCIFLRSEERTRQILL